MEGIFEITDELAAGHLIVAVVGEVDVATAPSLRTRLEQAVDDAEGALVVDLSGVTFIDSTALGVLIAVQRRSDDRGLPMRLVVAEPRILKIFEITGLTDTFSIVPDRAGALGA